MDSFLDVKPGLLFWSIINFLFFLVALYFIGGKKFISNIREREDLIKQALDAAETRKFAIQQLADENERRMKETSNIIDEAMKKAKEHSEVQAQIILEEAQKSRDKILKDATEEIERSKQAAINEIRNEVAYLVINSTEKLLEEKLDAEKDKQLVELYIDRLPRQP